MADDKDKGNAQDALSHRPLPYYVRLRCVIDEDRPAEILEFREMWAYSVTEALMQAILECGGEAYAPGALNKRITLEMIRPDLLAYFKMQAPLSVGVAGGTAG